MTIEITAACRWCGAKRGEALDEFGNAVLRGERVRHRDINGPAFAPQRVYALFRNVHLGYLLSRKPWTPVALE